MAPMNLTKLSVAMKANAAQKAVIHHTQWKDRKCHFSSGALA